MTILNAWVAGQSQIGQVDARAAISSLLVPGSSAVNTRAGIRPGGSGDPGAVTAGGTPDNAVRVAPLQGFIPSTRADGTFIFTADASVTIDVLTANPADPANARRDLIIVQQNDATFGVDANSDTLIRRVTGTPSGSPVDPTVTGSPDYMILARITVPAAATTITNAMITDLRPGRQVALGGLLPVASATERAALTAYVGMPIWRVDRSWTEVYLGAGAWRVQGVASVTAFADLATYVTSPYVGQLAVVTSTAVTYQYTGSTWVYAGPQAYIGSTTRTSAIGATTTETIADSITWTAVAGRRYKLSFSGSYFSTVALDSMEVRIRTAAGASVTTAGTLQRGLLLTCPTANGVIPLALAAQLTGLAAGQTTVGVFLIRNSGTGTVNLQAGATNQAITILEDIGV